MPLKIMKKQTFLIGFLSIMLILASQTYAQQNYWHTSDRYGVELDGEGDAFVVAILTFEGLKENTNIATVTLEIPGTRINVLKAIQTPYLNYYGNYYPETQQQTGSFITYYLNELSDSTLITLNLKTPILPNQQTTVVLIYQTQDIAKTNLNGLEFTFQTIKDSNAIIRDVGANIYVPSNMQLKGKPNFDIQYRPSVLAGTFGAASQTASISSSEMSRYISPYYTQSSQFSAQNLDPNESFTVKGLYGDNVFLLYLNEIIGVIIGLIILILVFKYLKIISRIKGAFRPKTIVKVKTNQTEFSWTRVFVAGIGSGFLYIVASLLIQFVFGLLQSFSYSGSYFMPLALILYLVLFLLPLVALFAPAIYLYKTYSWKEGLATFIIGVVTIIVLLYAMYTLFPKIQSVYY
jgi:hypothetical protein